MRTTYRMRAGRFVGIGAAGLILLGVAAVFWAIRLPGAVVVIPLVLGGLVLLAGLWVLAWPPVLLRLRTDELEVRGLRTPWPDITEVGRVETTHGEAIVVRTKQRENSILLPLSWLPPGRIDQLEADLRDHLNRAHGYRIWGGTAAPEPDRPE